MAAELGVRGLVLWLLLVAPRAGAQFVTCDGDRLSRGGQPLRMWGIHLAPAISSPPYERGELLAARLAALGFNAVVVWGDPLAFADPRRPGELPPTRRGDGSALDRMDFLIAELAERGVTTVLGAASRLSGVLATDFAGPPEARDAWALALGQVAANPVWSSRLGALQYTDEGVLNARVRFVRALLARTNPYTGRRYADDPAIGMIVLNERQAFLRTMFETSWEREHPYFAEQTRRQFVAFLRERYPDEAAWRRAWGEVALGESLTEGTITLAPGVEPSGRLSDLIAFARERVDRCHGRLLAAVRESAPAGVGANVIPVATDTVADAAWYGLYGVLGGSVAMTGGYWPLNPLGSALGEPLGFCGATSGGSLELRLAGRPWMLYATGQHAPQTFRAEYPMRVAVHASLHGAAGVFFHEWATALDDRGYNGAPLFNWPERGPFDLSVDSIVLSQLRVAGLLYRRGVIPPFPAPTSFRFGRGVLDDPAYGLGWFRTDQWLTYANTFHRRGATATFDADFAGTVAAGGELVDTPVPPRYEPASGVLLDRSAQRLIIDLPEAKVAVGRLGERWEFGHSIALRELATPFLAFGLVAADGRPLSESREAWLSAVAGVENTGFAYAADGTIAAPGSRPLRYRRVAGYLDLPPRQDRLLTGLTILMSPIPKVQAPRSLNLAGRDLVLTSELVATLPGEASDSGGSLFLPR